MSRAEKRRQQKKATKTARQAKPGQGANSFSEQQMLIIQQSLDLALKHYTAGRLPQAEDLYQQILQDFPIHPVALHMLGVIAHHMGKNDILVDLISQAVVIAPDYIDAHNHLGNALREVGKLDDAVASYHKALALEPNYAEAHNNLGDALKDLGRLDEADANYHKALALEPNYAEAGRNLLYAVLNVPGLTPKERFTEYLRFAERHSKGIARLTENLTIKANPDRRLRVGCLSSDFRNHPVGKNLFPLTSSHDRAAFEVFCYAHVIRPDEVTEQFKSCVDHWRPINGASDSDVARLVRADEIDILVCLAGHFDNNRPLVSAFRAAPVQVSYHDGAASGLEEMDYWLTDDFLHPADTKEMFTEELHRLPVLYQYPPIDNAPTIDEIPADQAEFITFGSFNNPAKINDQVIQLWADVLKSVPGSRLLFKYKNWYDQDSLRHRVVEGFATSGIERDRITFAVLDDTFVEYLERYGEVDIALDPFPFNGATTTFQSLWMGVPVVSLAGESFISRAAGSILHHAGLGEMAVDTPEAYVACARNLAGDLKRLRTLRATLRERMAGLTAL